jgi:hypothetical protein
MAYILNKTDGSILLSLQDGILDNTTTSIGLLGKNYVGYGEVQNENFIYLLENFANTAAPPRPIRGQLWYDTANLQLKVYDGAEWIPVGSAYSSSTAPPTTVIGALWLKSTTNQLYVYSQTGWQLIGPEALEGFGVTQIRASILIDDVGTEHAVLLVLVNDFTVAVITSEAFVIGAETAIEGFSVLVAGVNVSSSFSFGGNLTGNATSATRLQTARRINGVPFDGQNDITISSTTAGTLIKGSYLVGSDFNGSVSVTWSVDASSNNVIGKVVVRDSEGDFAANRITANEFIGLHRGNTSIDAGTSFFDKIVCNSLEGPEFTGNAFSASRLQPGRNINGVLFNGTVDITVPAAAETLTGSTIKSTVTDSSLQTVGTLNSLDINVNGFITFGGPTTAASQMYIGIESGSGDGPTIRSNLGYLSLEVLDATQPGSQSNYTFINSSRSLSLGGDNTPAFIPDSGTVCNLGHPSFYWNKVYATTVFSDLTGTPSVPSVIKTGTSGSGDIGQSLNKFNNVYAVTFNGNLVGTPSSPALIKTGVDGNGDIGQSNNKFNNVYAVTFNGEATTARYADLAENYAADAVYVPGTVLMFGGDKELTLAENETRKIAGVVSKIPAYLMNAHCDAEFVVPLALQGRVPCKVKGPISKGDMLISAGNGYAKACENPVLGSVIGKALQDFSGNEGMIEVVVGRL